ncbi:MAG: hypothetical protein WA666_09295 [Nitrospirota bacterium]
MKRLLTVLIAAALALTAYPAFASILGSPHDVTGVAGSTYGLCEACHVPHAAVGSKRLWNASPASLPFANWSTPKKIGALCGTCHLSAGGLHTIQNKGGLVVHLMDSFAYSDTSHSNVMATLATGANALDPQTIPAGGIAGKPYTNQVKMECTSCHNPHQDGPGNGTGSRPFLRAVTMGEPISDFCGECHSTRESSGTTALTATDNLTTGASNTPDQGGVGTWTHNHPVNILYGDNNAQEVGYYQALATGGALTTAFPYGVNNGALKGWSLGGKFLGGAGGTDATPITTPTGVAGETSGTDPNNYIGCQTCHAVHNPAADATAMNGGTAKGTWLLAVANTGTGADARADLCETCHGQANAAGGRWNTRVGSVVAGGDHPIDGAISPGAISTFIIGWSGPTRNFATPDPRMTVDRSAMVWPRGGTVTTGGVTGPQIICTSCHSAHRAGARLRRQNGDPGLWCKSCHPSVAPLGHHSNIYNLAGSTLDCTACHTGTLGGTAGGMAHNGFTFYVVAGDNTGSVGAAQVPWNQAVSGPATALANTGGATSGCTSCHFLGTSLIEPGSNPAPINRLGTPVVAGGEGTGAQTHYMGAIASNGGPVGINVKTTYWNSGAGNPGPMLPDHLGNRRDFSKYGTVLPGAVNVTEGTASFTPNTPSNGSILFVGCESCHSVLGNIGRTAALANMSSGWENNLLLQDYRDDSYSATSDTSKGGAGLTQANAQTVGSEFCVGCHNQGTADAQAAGAGYGTAGPVSAAVIIGNGKGGLGPNDITPPNMHPMTAWSITKAQDVGRLAAGYTNALMTTDTTDTATYGSYANNGPSGAGKRPPVNGGSSDTTMGAVSYPATNSMDCDSCHRPHNASKFSYSNASHISVRGKASGPDVPTILEFADVPNDNGSFCTKCHSY